jgi:hypothetical protein
MKTRADSRKGSKKKIAVASDDKVVSATVAKRDWFLKSSDLATLPRTGGGAAWGVGRFPTTYSTKDLDCLALRTHGVFGLARKKAARAKRLENKDTKTQVKRGRNSFWDDKDVEEVKFPEMQGLHEEVEYQRCHGRGAR